MSVRAIGSMWESMRGHSKSGKSIFLCLQLILHFYSDPQCVDCIFFSWKFTCNNDQKHYWPKWVGSRKCLPALSENCSAFHSLFNVPPGLQLASRKLQSLFYSQCYQESFNILEKLTATPLILFMTPIQHICVSLHHHCWVVVIFSIFITDIICPIIPYTAANNLIPHFESALTIYIFLNFFLIL